MGLFRGASDVDAVVGLYKEQINMLKEHIDRLEKQNKSLMEALIAAKSPDAYREMKAEEAALSNFKEESPEKLRRREIEYDVKKQWLENLESPTFNSFHEFEAFLRRKNPPTDEDVASEPLHPNTES